MIMLVSNTLCNIMLSTFSMYGELSMNSYKCMRHNLVWRTKFEVKCHIADIVRNRLHTL